MASLCNIFPSLNFRYLYQHFIIGFVSKEINFEISKTPRKILKFYGSLRGVKYLKQKTNEVLFFLDLVKIRNKTISSDLNKFSLYQRRLLLIGIELVFCPNILFLDDPFFGLTEKEEFDLAIKLFELKKIRDHNYCSYS